MYCAKRRIIKVFPTQNLNINLIQRLTKTAELITDNRKREKNYIYNQKPWMNLHIDIELLWKNKNKINTQVFLFFNAKLLI